jgi:hypothetical protein
MRRFVRYYALALVAGAALWLTAAGLQAQIGSATELIFDVRNGDQQGKLMLKDTELAFESLTDARHSAKWKYAEIRELGRNKSKELRVRPFKGDRYDFQFKDKQIREKIYDLISARILAARQGGR